MNPIAYLCGAINGCTDEEANDWRTLVKSLWPGRTLDPMRRDYRGREDEAVREIVELDKLDVAKADVVIVNYPGPSTGTDMEIFYAWMIGKPVVAVLPMRFVRVSPWLRYHTHALVHSYEEAVTTGLRLVP